MSPGGNQFEWFQINFSFSPLGLDLKDTQSDEDKGAWNCPEDSGKDSDQLAGSWDSEGVGNRLKPTCSSTFPRAFSGGWFFAKVVR